MSLAAKRVPSVYNHPLYHLDEKGAISYDKDTVTPKGHTYDPEPGANLVSSAIKGTDDHTPMLDLDVEAYLIPSSTPGHSHLYIEKPMSWRKYKKLLKALSQAGIVEEGYYKASVARGYSALRLRGVKKPGV